MLSRIGIGVYELMLAKNFVSVMGETPTRMTCSNRIAPAKTT